MLESSTLTILSQGRILLWRITSKLEFTSFTITASFKLECKDTTFFCNDNKNVRKVKLKLYFFLISNKICQIIRIYAQNVHNSSYFCTRYSTKRAELWLRKHRKSTAARESSSLVILMINGSTINNSHVCIFVTLQARKCTETALQQCLQRLPVGTPAAEHVKSGGSIDVPFATNGIWQRSFETSWLRKRSKSNYKIMSQMKWC